MKGIKSVFLWMKRYWYLIALSLIFNAVLQYLFSSIPIFVQEGLKLLENNTKHASLPNFIINYLVKKDIIDALFIIGLMIIGIQIFRSLMRFTDNYLKGYINESISKDMRISIYAHINDLSYTYHNNSDCGDLIQRCTSDIETSTNFMSRRFVEMINIFITIFCGAYRMYKINPTIMLVSIIIIPFVGIGSILFFKAIATRFRYIEEAEANMTTVIQENVNNIKVVKAFSNEAYEMDKLDKSMIKYSTEFEKFAHINGLYWAINDSMVILQYIITIGVGIYLTKKGIVDGADIAASMMLMGLLVWPMRGLGRGIADLSQACIAMNRIDEIYNEKSEFENDSDYCPNIDGNIEFKDVSFKFMDSNEYTLKNISFKVNKGETLAIMGKTGSGKSTIGNLLTRLLDYSGSILIDGIELNTINKKHIRRNIALVSQDAFLFSKTIRENIKIANPSATDDEMIKACKIACIHDEIMSFKDGYDTIVGEKGTTLSGGQKQRMAIARALVSDKKVIIFDDSLSALDTKTDLSIRTSLKDNKGITTIIITHRLSTAKEADNIIVLKDQTILETGNHEYLANNNGLYKKLCEIQGMLEEEFIDTLGSDINE